MGRLSPASRGDALEKGFSTDDADLASLIETEQSVTVLELHQIYLRKVLEPIGYETQGLHFGSLHVHKKNVCNGIAASLLVSHFEYQLFIGTQGQLGKIDLGKKRPHGYNQKTKT